MNGPPPENANAPTEGPRRSSDVNGSPHSTAPETKMQPDCIGPEPLRDVLARVLGRVVGREGSS